jgi:hypothetical protein
LIIRNSSRTLISQRRAKAALSISFQMLIDKDFKGLLQLANLNKIEFIIVVAFCGHCI